MRTLAIASALALVGGLGTAAPALAGYYDVYGNYHPTYGNYGYSSGRSVYERDGMMSRGEIRRALISQGYDDVTNLRREPFSGEWVATAYSNGELVRVTVDPYSGRVLYATEI